MKYIQLYIKNAVLVLCLLFSTHISYGMEQGTPNDNNQPGTLLADERMPPELLHEIFYYLSSHDLRSMRESSRFGNMQVVQYVEEQLLLATRQLKTFNPRISNDQVGGILSMLGERDKKTLFGLLETRMGENQFLLALPKSPMAFHLYNHPGFKPLNTDMMMNHIEDAKLLYRALFNCDLPEDNPINTKIALDHVLAAWPLQTVFFKKGNEAQGASAFFQTHTQELIGKLSSLGTEKPYVSFMNHGILLEHMNAWPHHIVVSSEQLVNPNAKVILVQLLEQNPEHMIVLSVEEGPFVVDGCLNLKNDNLPSRLKHLRLVNPSGDITTIGNNFLLCCRGLTSVDFSGLMNVIKVGDKFCLSCDRLTSVDFSGWCNVITFGGEFLWGCAELTTIDWPSFMNVTKIETGFLAHCFRLTSIDLSSFMNVTKIESEFLYNCGHLTSVDLPPLTNVTTIGNGFLRYCSLDEESKRKVEAFLEQVKNRAK